MNFEIKIKISDPEKIKAAFKKINAKWKETCLQDDTCFDVENGFLKIRRSDNKPTQLIQYFKNPSSMGMQSNYAMVSMKKTDRISIMLARTHGIKAQVQKIREIWQWNHLDVHLDKVEGLGFFIKLVAADSNDRIEDDIHREMNRLLVKLKLDNETPVSKAYSEMMVEKGEKV